MTYVYNSQLDAFTIYHVTREENTPKSIIGPALPALGHATSGAAGTVVSKLLTYPLDLVITRLQAQRQFQTTDKDAQYDGVLDAIQKIYEREGGISAFYSGVGQETVKGVVDSFLFFLAYTYARQKRLASAHGGVGRLSAVDEIGVGVVAGAFAKLFTTPLQNIVTRKQAAAMIAARDPTSSITPSLSTRDIARQIRGEKGLQGFWSGYSASLILTLNPSITFLLHRVLLKSVVPKSKQQDPGARITFLLAAISKAMASTLTYPFSLAKTRAQVSSQKPTQPKGPAPEDDKLEHVVEAKAIQARERTVVGTILQIARTEGIGALYQGLGAEVLKAFFSHGVTMLVKDRIHALIIDLYYLVLKTMKKYPSPEEMAKMASEQAKDAYAKGVEVAENATTVASEQAKGAYSKGVEVAGNASTMAQDALRSGTQRTGELLESGKDVAKNTSQQAQDVISSGKQQAQDTLSSGKQQAGELLGSGTEAARNTSQQVKESIVKANVRDINGNDD